MNLFNWLSTVKKQPNYPSGFTVSPLTRVSGPIRLNRFSQPTWVSKLIQPNHLSLLSQVREPTWRESSSSPVFQINHPSWLSIHWADTSLWNCDVYGNSTNLSQWRIRTKSSETAGQWSGKTETLQVQNFHQPDSANQNNLTQVSSSIELNHVSQRCFWRFILFYSGHWTDYKRIIWIGGVSQWVRSLELVNDPIR